MCSVCGRGGGGVEPVGPSVMWRDGGIEQRYVTQFCFVLNVQWCENNIKCRCLEVHINPKQL